MAPKPTTQPVFTANSATIDDLSPVPNGILAFALAEVSSHIRPPAYELNPDDIICLVFLAHALPANFPFEHLEIFSAVASCAYSECTVAQYFRSLLRLHTFVEPFKAATRTTACLFLFFFCFGAFYVAERFQELTANGDSIRKECHHAIVRCCFHWV